ncbi:MAG: hypothetical protein Q9O24_07070 [Gammaproteobacteria bacterium]|nr:hypothetical protein [Gammaproteobacteria bacterium]
MRRLQRRLSGISNRLQRLLPKWRSHLKQLVARQLQKQAVRLQRLIQQSKLARAESLERVKGESLP